MLKAAHAWTVREEVLPNVENTFVAAIDNEDDVDLDLHIVGGRRSLNVAADFEPGY